MIHFIAEVSSNHHQDVGRCLEFIDSAAASGFHSVKFQLFKISELFSPEILSKSPAHRSRKDWELPTEFLAPISERCKAKGIQFSCTPFYLGAVKELEPYVDFFKVASYELLWDDLLAACAKTGKPVVISSGMATMPEILHAVEVLRANGCTSPTLLHCTSAYPTPHTEANLAAIQTLRQATQCDIGWSDHTVNPGVIHRAIHRWGATTIELHLDLDGQGDEFKTGHCWLPHQIAAVIRDVNHALESDGDGVKAPVPSELPDRDWRADPSDGLRPLKHLRQSWQPSP